MSLQKSTNTLEAPVRAAAVPHRKPKADLYTILLVIALLAVLIAIMFLWLELAAYDYKTKGGPVAAVASTEYKSPVRGTKYGERGLKYGVCGIKWSSLCTDL